MILRKKVVAFLHIDNMIDLITNSSSELFVIKASLSKDVIVEMVNEAIKGFSSISEDSLEMRFFKEGSIWDQDYKMTEMLEMFDEDDREEIKLKYLTNPKYYGVVFDRDYIYQSSIDVRSKLAEIGFELIDTDY